MNLVEAMHNCNTGEHDLIEISRSGGYETDDVVRWCRVCGAVVVDLEVDGRLWKPGGRVKMMAPQVAKHSQLYYSSQDDESV